MCIRDSYFTVRSRSELDAGVAGFADRSGLPFRVPGPDELPSADDDAVTTRIDVAEHAGARVAAMRAHATQIAVWDDPHDPGFVTYAMSNGVGQPFGGLEEFVLVGAEPGRAETDLFEGIGR